MARLFTRNKDMRTAANAGEKTVLLNLKNKLIGSFAVLLLVPTLSLAIASYQTAKSKVEEQLMQSAGESVKLLDAAINDFFEGKKQSADLLSETVSLAGIRSEGTNIGVDPALRSQLMTFIRTHKDVEMAFVGTETGLYVDSAEVTKIAADYDPRARGWYKQAMTEKGQAVITSPYKSAATGNLVVTVAKSTKDGLGVVALSVPVTKLATMTGSVKLGEEGFVFLADKDRKFVYHPTVESGKELGSMPENEYLYSHDTGSYSYLVNGTDPKKMVFYTNAASGWKIIGTMFDDEVARQAQPILNATVLVLAVSVLLGAALVITILYSVLTPLKQINRVSLKISEGDLSEEIEVKRMDEFGVLSTNFNTMARSLRQLIQQVNGNAMQLAAAAEQLTASSEQISEAGKQVAQAVQEVADGSGEQVVRVNETRGEMSGMTSQLQHISRSADEVAEAAGHTEMTAKDGNEAILTIIGQMNSIGEKVMQLSSDVAGLGERSNQIVKFAEVITEISSQTNLLALNASIEAARAGEQGKGFAVVASEIKKLANQSSDSAHQISQLIAAIQKSTETTVASMDIVTNEVKQGVYMVDAAGGSFQHILESIRNVALQIEQVSKATQGMAGNSENVLQAIAAVSGISEDAAASIQQVAASTEEQLASMQEVAASSAVLGQMAEELQETVGRFKV
ncbi:methyl-accepting chemotaxis protein [Paenibacillus mucilaginosus]|uniref:methyl-accepting chemotaxis protein n=1 Tax=Paenibacillus mucilaginosus TaxID=61624 RepID=UPI003D1DCB5E